MVSAFFTASADPSGTVCAKKKLQYKIYYGIICKNKDKQRKEGESEL